VVLKIDYLQLTAEDRLWLILPKVKRAKEHFANLIAEADKFRDAKRSINLGDKNADTEQVLGRCGDA
jgi:hypothetical protein